MVDILKDGIPAIIEAADRARAPEVINVGASLGVVAPMAVRPVAGGGYVLESVKATIDAFRVRPERRKGTATLTTLESFADHARRFMDADSAIFVCDSPKAPSFTAVLNYHESVNVPGPEIDALPVKAGDPAAEMIHVVDRAALPRFGDHRGVYTPEFSDEWKLWTDANGKPLDQASFGRLIERGARCIFDVDSEHPEKLGEQSAWFAQRFGRRFAVGEFFGSSDAMLQLAEGLTANVEETIGETNVRGASRSVVFVSKTSTDTVTVPTAFLLALPVFKGGELWQVPARLGFKPVAKGETRVLEWKIELWDTDATVKACLADMAATVKARTGLPCFTGTPEP